MSLLFAILSISSLFFRVHSVSWPPTIHTIPPSPVQGITSFITNASQGPFDAPKSSIVNETILEWWYFDACSSSGDQGIAVWFFTTSPLNLGLSVPSSNFLLVHARFSDRTGSNIFIPADEAIIMTDGEGSSGLFSGTGSGWSGASDLGNYEFWFDDKTSNVSGSVYITSEASAHFATEPATDPDAQEMNVANLGWAVSIPAGDATAYVEVNGKTIEFIHGSGYHDHNWGQGLSSFESWYAVRAQAGPFSFTVVQAILTEGEFGTAYVSFGNKAVFVTLDATAITVRPWGNETVYPPIGFDPQPLGCTIMLVDEASGVEYEFNFTSKTDSPKIDLGKGLAKWFGVIVGGEVGCAQYEGSGMFEWLDLAI